MDLKFGTSGLRGPVSALTPEAVTAWTRAYLAACPPERRLFVGRDLRPSSPAIATAVAEAARAAGLEVVDCGALPTPALALAATGASAVMVTGSHIPADRNGLKFYTPAGEITKAEEAAISAALTAGTAPDPRPGGQILAAGSTGPYVARPYVARYETAFGPEALAGLRIGVYQHSAVGRDLLVTVLAALGAEPVPLARSETFVPVDTEAVDPATRALFAGWCTQHRLDALVSTDGDGDRPMLADAAGQVVPGDVLGLLTAQALGADMVVTPVSSNTMVSSLFARTALTRIGSPFVVAGMEAALGKDPGAKVVGFEANGGFLLGFTADAPAGALAPLMTRDSLLPMVAPLAAAHAAGHSLAEAVAALPARFTAADRLQGIAPDRARALLDRLESDDASRAAFFSATGEVSGIDLTDGLRLRFGGGEIVHLRPSGNAPEFRVYAEAGTRAAARSLVAHYMAAVAAAL